MALIDDTDRRILNTLQQDCALTNQELAGRVHVSAPTCLRRVRRLIEEGVIERQIAIVSPQALAAGLTAIVEVTLERQSTDLLEQFEHRLAGEGAVQQCYRVSAGPSISCPICPPTTPSHTGC
jgi:Lrp/AsnC family leucine-responsive transcriptional regulator